MEQVTDKQIKEWKDKYGDVLHIDFEDGRSITLRKPDMQVLSMYLSMIDSNPLKAQQMLLKNCRLAGDDEVVNDSAYILSSMEHTADLIQKKASTSKKY